MEAGLTTTPDMATLKNLLIAGLATALAVVALLAWRQQGELKRLRHESRARAPVVVLRTASGRRVMFPPPKAWGAPLEDERIENFGSRMFSDVPPPDHQGPPPRRGALGQLTENPEFLNALGVYQEGGLDARFAALFRQLHLSPSELANFKRLLAEKENAEVDVVAMGESVPENPLSPQDLKSTVDAVKQRVEKELRESLGEDRYAAYRDYEQTLPQRTTVAQLEQRLSYSGTPLTPVQSESLVRILASNSAAHESSLVAPSAALASGEAESAVPVVRRGNVSAVVSDAALTQSQSVLSNDQVAALRQIQFEQHSALRASQLIQLAFPGGADSIPPSWPLLFQ